MSAPSDVFVSWLPLYHDMGLIGAWLGSLYFAAPLVVMSPLAFLVRPRRGCGRSTAIAATLSAAPNFAFELCLRRVEDAMIAGLDLGSLRMVANGAEAVSPETVRRFAARFARLRLPSRGDGAGLRPRRERRRPRLPAAGPAADHRPDRPQRPGRARLVPRRPRRTQLMPWNSSPAAGRCPATRSASSMRRARSANGRRAGCSSADPRRPSGYLDNPEKTARTVRRPVAEQRRPRLRRRRRRLHHRPHPRTSSSAPAAISIRRRSRRRSATSSSFARAASPSSERPTRAPAPSSLSWSQKRA